jgi:hypothetical protein
MLYCRVRAKARMAGTPVAEVQGTRLPIAVDL